MQEDYLHYLWKFKKIDTKHLISVDGEVLNILSVGQHNYNSGPDFFNAQIEIDNQLWAGNVEIHLKSSDWYVHNHETDKAYDNIILHVVWEHDVDVFRKNNTVISTLELQNYISKPVLDSYYKLYSGNKRWINCESDFKFTDEFLLKNWIERLYFERLERKSTQIEELLSVSNQNWEAVLFQMLAKNFGLKLNGEAFLSMATSFDFSIVRKIQNKEALLEALFHGQCGLLEEPIDEPYYVSLQNDYKFLSQKFQLNNQKVLPVQFFRLRPPNFPTIRLSQLAQVYALNANLFSKIMEETSLEGFYTMFSVETSEFWKNHYTFKKASKPVRKKISKSFTDLLLINTILPLKFSYGKYLGKDNSEVVLDLIKAIQPERNTIVEKFELLKPIFSSALQTQGVIQLKTEYCNRNKCLQCAVGNSILNRI
ncbi:DUF2851 family protein [Formosa sp. S-31]|uniref:DUF2851 family protein n=1 Tax=Formosa sp. S-31 TaxID=2790949 RepID=UPI003EC02E6C